MRVSTEDGRTWYEANGRKAVVYKRQSGYALTSFWDGRDGKHWCGGYAEGTGVSLEEATDLAKRFVSGQSVPEELGGFDDNKPEEVTK